MPPKKAKKKQAAPSKRKAPPPSPSLLEVEPLPSFDDIVEQSASKGKWKVDADYEPRQVKLKILYSLCVNLKTLQHPDF